MFEDIQKHRQAVAENIEKSLQIGYTESEDLEKAHNVGDVHPNGKWVWTQLPSGKYDWRVIKKTQNPVSGNVSTQQAVDDAKAKMAAGVAAKKQTGGFSVDTSSTEWQSEYKKQKQMADSVDSAARQFALSLIKNNIESTKDKIVHAHQEHPSAKSLFRTLNADLTKFDAQLKAVEDSIKDSLKSQPKSSTGLKTISEVEDYAKSIPNVTFKSVKTGLDKEPKAKAFELTYSKGGKMVIDFLNEEEFIYRLTDNTGKVIIDTNSTSENSRTDWSKQLNPSSVISERVNWMKQRLTKLKGERTKAQKRHFSHPSDFTDRYEYQQAIEAVNAQEKKIKDWEGYISKF